MGLEDESSLPDPRSGGFNSSCFAGFGLQGTEFRAKGLPGFKTKCWGLADTENFIRNPKP